MDYPKSTPGVGLVDGLFVDENPTNGQPGSLIPSAWANALMAELLGVIKGAGLVPDEDDNAQLLRAIQSMALSDFKKSVRCATTGPIALSGLQTIDDVQLSAGDRVLVKNQASASQNWIYVVSAGAWVRAQDADESAECAPGHLIPVQAGTTNNLTVWQLTNTEAPVVGTTALTFRVAIGKQGTTLADYGIGDAYTKAQTYSQAQTYSRAQVDELLLSVATSTGLVAHFARPTPPNGWLRANGAAVSRTSYAALFAAIGTTFGAGDGSTTFNLPDLRGEFVRGWDDGRGVDNGRALGSQQTHLARSLNRSAYGDQAGGSLSTDMTWTYANGMSNCWTGVPSGNSARYFTFYADAAETRPRNVAMLACIKY